MTAQLEARCTVCGGQQQRAVVARPLPADDAADQVEEQVLRALGRPRCRGRIARRRGEHEAVHVGSGAADGEQRKQRGAEGLLGRIVCCGQAVQRVAQFVHGVRGEGR
jgi:hypothetical protein